MSPAVYGAGGRLGAVSVGLAFGPLGARPQVGAHLPTLRRARAESNQPPRQDLGP